MSTFGGLILTNRGRNLQAKVQTGVTLNYTRIAVGDGQLGTSQIAELTAMKHEIMTLPIIKLLVQGSNRATIGTVLRNNDLTSGFYFRELGVFASDPELGEILYCYGNAGTLADYIPVGGGADIIEKIMDIIVLTGNATNVTANIDQSLVYLTASAVGQPGGIPPLDDSGKIPSQFVNINEASTTQKGVTQLEDSVSSTSTTKAATPNSVKTVNDNLTTLVEEFTTHLDDGTIHVTQAEKDKINATDNAKFKKGSSTYTDNDTAQTFVDAFCTNSSLVTIVITSVTNPQGVWSVVSADGSFTITSTVAESADITFDYYIQKAVG